jgi:hypothetical protein
MLCEIYTETGLFADDFLSPEAAKKHADQNLPLGEEIVIQQPGWKLWFGVAGEPAFTQGGRLPKWPLRKADSSLGLRAIGASEHQPPYSRQLTRSKEDAPAELPPLFDEAASRQHAADAGPEGRRVVRSPAIINVA